MLHIEAVKIKFISKNKKTLRKIKIQLHSAILVFFVKNTHIVI